MVTAPWPCPAAPRLQHKGTALLVFGRAAGRARAWPPLAEVLLRARELPLRAAWAQGGTVCCGLAPLCCSPLLLLPWVMSCREPDGACRMLVAPVRMPAPVLTRVVLGHGRALFARVQAHGHHGAKVSAEATRCIWRTRRPRVSIPRNSCMSLCVKTACIGIP